MNNNTVALSVVEDLIHWPLPPADPTEPPASTTGTNTNTNNANNTNQTTAANITSFDALLSAGAAEELDEEPRERQLLRYDAVRRLPALVRVMGSQWAKMEVIPYMLRCIEEEDAELSFATGMALIDLATGPVVSSSQLQPPSPSPVVSEMRTERLFLDITRPLSLTNFLPVLVRMSASTDAGVRLFLVEVVIPTLFFGVSLERTVDLRDWESKYLKLRSRDGDENETGEVSKVTFDVNNASGVHTVTGNSNSGRSTTFDHRRPVTNSGSVGVGIQQHDNNSTGTTNNTSSNTATGRSSNSNSSGSGGGGVNPALWDPFQINLYANRIRSAIATYLRDVVSDNSNSSESDGKSGPMMAMYGKAIGPSDYINHRDRREAFRARWNLLIGLIESMLKSEYATTVSTGVECISNIFSCISWVTNAEKYQETVQKTSIVRSIEELVSFTFTATRNHVGRVIRSGAEKPCEDLMMLLFDHHLLIENSISSSSSSSTSTSTTAGTIALGSGGLSAAAREVWDLCLTGSTPVMHRLVRVSLLRSLPQLINWSTDAAVRNVEKTSIAVVASGESLGGLSFFSVCHIFTQALTPPVSRLGKYGRDVDDDESTSTSNSLGDDKGETDHNNNNNNHHHSNKENAVTVSTSLIFESDVCHDFGIAEAVLDGVQYLFDELLHPHTVEEFLRSSHRRQRLHQLTKLYSECVVHSVTLPSWRTRWLTTQRLPQLTTTFMLLINRLGCHKSVDGSMLIESTVVRLCTLHIEQWSSSDSGDGCLKELVNDEEEEVRSVAALCAARVFCALGQGMFRLVFPNGIVMDMKSQQGQIGKGGGKGGGTNSNSDNTRMTASSSRAAVGSLSGGHVDPNTMGSSHHDTTTTTTTTTMMMGSTSTTTSSSSKQNKHTSPMDAPPLLSVNTLMKHLPNLLDAILSCCLSLLRDSEERVRAGAAAGLSALARTLSTMITVCDLHTHDIGKTTWLRYLDRTTAALMTLLNDNSPTVQLALVSEFAALLTNTAAGAGRIAASMGGSRHADYYYDEVELENENEKKETEVREGALVACLRSLARHEIWRYRARYATLLSEMCVKFLAPSSLAAAEAAAPRRHAVHHNNSDHHSHTLEVSLRESSVAGGRPSGVVLAEDVVNPLHQFAKRELLPLLVDVLFDKVKAVRDSALESLQRMCDRLSAVRLQLMNASPNTDNNSNSNNSSSSNLHNSNNNNNNMSHGMTNSIGNRAFTGSRGVGTRGSGTISTNSKNNMNSTGRVKYHDDDVFINDTLWPLIINSPKAMATYLSRSSLLRIAIRLGVDKESILLPLLDQLGHDAVLNVRLVVAKELYGILAASSNTTCTTPIVSGSSFLSWEGIPKVTFTPQEKNGVVLQLLRLLVEDKSADVRDEAAKALTLCF